MLTPYRISGREDRRRVPVARSTILALRVAGWLFALAAGGAVLALGLIGQRCAAIAITLGEAMDVVEWVGIAALALVIGGLTNDRALKLAAFIAVAASMTGFITPVMRFAALGALATIPLLAGSGRAVPRWALISVAALSLGNLIRFDGAALAPSIPSIAVFALLAHAYFATSRALSGETFDEKAERFSLDDPRLFADARDRATFVGPMRAGIDIVVALAIVTCVHSLSVTAYSASFRLDAPPFSVEASALLALFVFVVVRAKPATRAPLVAAIVAGVAAVYSTVERASAAASIALLIVSLAIVGLVLVGPRVTAERAATASRRFTQASCAAGVFLGSAGFFALASFGEGEPALARLAKVGAVVAAIVAARAFAKLETHARVELAAEQREP